MKARGIEHGSSLLIDVASHTEPEVSAATEELIDSPLRPTAIIALNSALMPAIASKITDRGLSVPDQLAIGCVDYAMPPNFKPDWPVVTLKLDLRRQGELAARTLVEMLRNRSAPVESRYIEPELLVLEP